LQLFKVKCVDALSNVAFNSNLRRYNKAGIRAVVAQQFAVAAKVLPPLQLALDPPITGT